MNITIMEKAIEIFLLIFGSLSLIVMLAIVNEYMFRKHSNYLYYVIGIACNSVILTSYVLLIKQYV